MSNSKNILYLFSLVFLMLTGCEADSSWAPLPDREEEPVEVRFHAINVGADVTVSRANYVEREAWVTGDEVGIWNEFYNHLSLKYSENTTPNLSTTNNEAIYYPYQTGELSVYAYAPYSTDAFNAETNSVWVKSEWEEENAYSHYITDPVWAVDVITKTAPTAEFAFAHPMSRLKMNLIPETNVTYTNYTITLTFDRAQYGSMDLETGEITSSDSNRIFEYSEQGTVPTDYDHTIIPESILKEIKVTFTEDDTTTYEYVHSYQGTEQDPYVDFIGGNMITMNIDFAGLKAYLARTQSSN